MRLLELRNGDRLSVRDRALVLSNRQTGELERTWSLRAFPFDTLSLGPYGGSISFDAIRWLVSVKASVFGDDWTLGPAATTHTPKQLRQVKAHLDRGARFKLAKFVVHAKVGRTIPHTIGTLEGLRGFEGSEAAILLVEPRSRPRAPRQVARSGGAELRL